METGSILLLHPCTPQPQEQTLILGKTMKKIFQANGPQHQTAVTIVISDNIDFKPKLCQRDMEGHYILIKEKISKKVLQF